MELTRIMEVEGTGIPVRGDDIDTDRIIPARYLKEITFSRMGEYPFYDERFTSEGEEKGHPFNDSRFEEASLLVVNANFGCGSSREHAPQALMRWGIKAVIAESLAEIFAGNCTMIGVPAVTLPTQDIRKIQDLLESRPETPMHLNLQAKTLTLGKDQFKVQIPESRRQALIEGTWNSTALLLSNLPLARKTAGALPYQKGFLS
jgi:3-isopropylmalate/(R)-2-methylmalate dehydratase small subunit